MSRLPFELLLALRYLRPKRTFVSVITLISVLGVTLGVAVLIIVISVMSGFDEQLRDKILGFNTHLKILPRGETMTDYAARRAHGGLQPRTSRPWRRSSWARCWWRPSPRAASRRSARPGFAASIPLIETNMSVLPNSIVEGKFDVSDRGLLVGTEFAHNMGLQVGDRVEIGSPSVLKKWRESSKKENAPAPVLPEYEVRGIFDVGYYEYNLSVIVTSLRDAQDLYDLDDSVHGLLVMLHDPYQAPEVEAELARRSGPTTSSGPGCRRTRTCSTR